MLYFYRSALRLPGAEGCRIQLARMCLIVDTSPPTRIVAKVRLSPNPAANALVASWIIVSPRYVLPESNAACGEDNCAKDGVEVDQA